VYLVHAELPEGPTYVFTLLPPGLTMAQGLAPHAIVGGLIRPLEPGEQVTPAVFARNFYFVEFLHEFLGATAPQDPCCQAEAKRLGKGWIYIIDQRTPTPGGDVPPEDILGAIEVVDGKIVQGTYRRSEYHRIFTDHGFFNLGPWLEARLVEAMSRPLPHE
jgi:hypothetical protein